MQFLCSGKVSISKILFFKSVFEEKPELWETLRVEFAKCEVFLPTLEESNWTVDQEDMDRIIGIFGVDATIGDFFDDDYVKELEVVTYSFTFNQRIYKISIM